VSIGRGYRVHLCSDNTSNIFSLFFAGFSSRRRAMNLKVRLYLKKFKKTVKYYLYGKAKLWQKSKEVTRYLKNKIRLKNFTKN